MDKWETVAERKVREAMAAGEFENLPGKGKPLSLDSDPFEDPTMWMAHHLLRVNGFAPAWIEESKEIDLACERLRDDAKSGCIDDSLRRRASELNRRILGYNLKTPSVRLHKKAIVLE